MNLAPIVLFVYNRLSHTQQTINALKENNLSNLSDLIIYSDAPKTQEQTQSIQKVRDYIKQVNGFKTVTIVEREINFGLAKSIIEGVTEVCEKYGRIIVLEDDLETSPYFLQYMNDALNVYENQEQVMSIAGYTFPIESAGLNETFFLKVLGCWGWATWSRAWKFFEKNPKKLIEGYTEDQIYNFNLENSYDFWAQVKQNESGAINTWAIFWYASMFQKQGLCLYPLTSMVNNIGHDDTGTHCSTTDEFHTDLGQQPIKNFESNIIESNLARTRTSEFLKRTRPSFLAKCRAAFKNKIYYMISYIRS